MRAWWLKGFKYKYCMIGHEDRGGISCPIQIIASRELRSAHVQWVTKQIPRSEDHLARGFAGHKIYKVSLAPSLHWA